MLRELARHFGQRPDAHAHPLGHLWDQLDKARRDRPDLLALYRRIKHGADGQPAGDQSCSLLEVFDALVQYRNDVIGHGGPRFDSFFTGEMGPLLFPAANEILSEGTFDLLGPRGSRLVYVAAELRQVDEDRVEVGLRELIGKDGERAAPMPLVRSQAAALAGRVAVIWPGRAVPLRLDPLLLYREGERSSDMLFLNRDLNGRQVQYLNYSTGRTERDRATAPALAALLSRVTGHEISEEQLQALAEQSRAETPSVESLFGPKEPVSRVMGGYEVLAEIGRGGMGVVFLSRQLSLGRLVALKMLPADRAGDEVALSRFRRELRLLARCEHPHIDSEDEVGLTERIFHQDVPRLRTIDPTFDRDLEAIVSRATERRAADRIASANQLAEYLQLYLDGQPLPIRPPSTAEIVGRWVRGHKPMVGSVAAAVLAIMTTIVVAFVLITRSRNEKADLAQRETRAKDKANALAGELSISLKDTDRERRNAFNSLSDLYFERGKALCLQGDSGRGLLWLASALLHVTEDRAGRAELIRIHLALEGREASSLKQIIEDPLRMLAISADCGTAVMASDENTARLVNTADGTPIGIPLLHRDPLVNVAISADGKIVATATDDNKVRLWNASDGAPIGRPLLHRDSVLDMAFSADQEILVTRSDRAAHLWKVADGAPIGTPL